MDVVSSCIGAHAADRLADSDGHAVWNVAAADLIEGQKVYALSCGACHVLYGTGGTLGSKYLQKTISQRFFPKLWEVRSKFFQG